MHLIKFHMRLITLSSILLSSFVWQNAVAEDVPKAETTAYSLAVHGSTCDPLSPECTKPTIDKFNTCRVNTKGGCTFDLTVTDTQTKIDPTTVKDSKQAAIITIKKMEPLDNLVLDSVKITVSGSDNLDDAKQLMIKTEHIDNLQGEDVAQWTVRANCTPQNGVFTCTGKTPIKAPFYIAVTKTDKTPAVGASFGAVVTLKRQEIHSIPKLSATEAKYKLDWDPACQATDDADCTKELTGATAVKDCLTKHQKDGCKVTPTIKLTSTTKSLPIETSLDGITNGLAAVFVDASVFPAELIDAKKVFLKSINFGLEANKITANAELLINPNLADFSKGKVNGAKADTTGSVTQLPTAAVDLSAGKFVYLSKDIIAATDKFQFTAELTGDAKKNEAEKTGPPPPPTYELATSAANVETCASHPPECNTESNKIKNVEQCITNGKNCKLTFTWTYTQTAVAALPDATGKFPIVYFDNKALNIPDGITKMSITEITVDEAKLTKDCFTAESTIKAGGELKSLTLLTGTSLITEVKENKTFKTNIDAKSKHYYQIQPANSKSNCDITANAKISFTVTGVVEPTTLPPHVDPKTELEQHAEWTHSAITAEITDSGAQCTNIQECKSLSDVAAMEKCITTLTKNNDCKAKKVSFKTTLTGGPASLIKVENKDAAAFEIKSIKDSKDLNLGLTNTDTHTAIPVKITKIEGDVPVAEKSGKYELFQLKYAENKYSKKDAKIGDVTASSDGTAKLAVSLATSIPLTSEIAFGLFKAGSRSLLRSRRLEEDGGEAAGKHPSIEIQKIVITVQSDATEANKLNAASPDAATKKPQNGMTGFINGGMFLTAVTLLFSWVM